MAISCLCLGPKRAGKTHLLKALQEPDSIDETSYSMPTVGTNIFSINIPADIASDGKSIIKLSPPETMASDDNTTVDGSQLPNKNRIKRNLKQIQILEIGGSMAPLWRRYFDDLRKLIYVVDTSNLCQISAAGVLFYSILAEPRVHKVRILLVLTKMDYAYRQMRNEALLMLQMPKLQKQIRQNITIVEASSVTKVGFDDIYNWLQIP